MKGNKFFKKIDRYLGIPLVWAAGMVCRILDLLTRPPSKDLSPGDRVLAVKLSALGDTLILLPVLKALKQKVGKDGRVVMLATSINQPALEGFPYVDEILLLDFGRFLKNPLALWRFLGRLRKSKPSIALDFDQWLRISPFLCFLSGASRRYGFKTGGQGRHFLYSKAVPNSKGSHESDQFASVAGLAGIGKNQVENFNGFLEREKLFGGPKPGEAKKSGSLKIHFHPGCGSYGWQRAWPVESYVQLADKLHQALEVEIRATGMGGYEQNLVHELAEKSKAPIQDHSGPLEMSAFAHLLRQADLVICGNTGTLHLAVGLGKPTLLLNGPADPVKWGPSPSPSGSPAGKVRVLSARLLCSPCTTLGFEYGCPYRSCMEAIEPEEVFKECLAFFPEFVVGKKG